MSGVEGKWFVETRKGKIEGGGSYEEKERVRILNRENGKRIIEAIVLSDVHIDSGGNRSTDTHKGYHYVALLEGKKQLSFAVDFTKSPFYIHRKLWRVLSDDCLSFCRDVKTKKEAIELLAEAGKGVSK